MLKFPHLKLSENCCSIIGNKQLLQVVDDHFIHTWKATVLIYRGESIQDTL